MANVDDVDQSADAVAVQKFYGKLLFLRAKPKICSTRDLRNELTRKYQSP